MILSKLHTFILMLFVLITANSFGQISPGDLAQSHAHLEGMSNCTKCHELGDKVSSKKCLDCHTEIQSLINQRKGYHANQQVVNKDCFKCHSEHHGRKFDMIRFDQNAFNHNLTGYALEGKHSRINCKDCHTADKITDQKIKQRKNTFLGLGQECLSCHEDFHQKTLSNQCNQCHVMDAFKPASKFDHSTASFKLEGKHKALDCTKCHKHTTKNGKDFQQFTNIPSNDCKSCHSDPHNSQLKGQCSQCHTEQSFSTFIGKGRFNHNTANFKLKGSHKNVDCFSCHNKSSNPTQVFQDQINKKEDDCIACHADKHNGKFGSECVKCHQESSFLALKQMKFFNHTVTDYPLEGKHLDVDCKKCHTGRFSDPIQFNTCNSCHKDYHNGEFKKNGQSPDCKTCHSLDKGFDYSLFTIEKHQTTAFPLSGAHTATPCFACHVSESKWKFRNLGSTCADCHQDIHKGFINKKYYPENNCKSCHVDEAWSMVKFDHKKTKWPLEGKHVEVACQNCHFTRSKNNTILKQTFSSLDSKCTSCHENIHGKQFAINGVTDCKRCHSPLSWFPNNFDHNNTAFPLEGRHAELACNACHKPEIVNGKEKVIYKIKKFKCIDCHS